jgi:hypothetical protein
MNDTTFDPQHPAPGVTVLGRRATHSIGALGSVGATVVIGPASGSQRDAGMVAHIVFSRPGSPGMAYGVTTADPDAMEKTGRTLIAAAMALREARS